MSSSSGMSRLVKLYGLLERLRARELRSAAAALQEVESAERRVRDARTADQLSARNGLSQGSRVESFAAESAEGALLVQSRFLGKLRETRAGELADSAHMHQQSAMQLKQLEKVLEHAKQAATVEAQRRFQAASDDRFLARREWVKAEGRARTRMSDV